MNSQDEQPADRRVDLGTVSVDSGRLLLVDPAYARDDRTGLDEVRETIINSRFAAPAFSGLGLVFAAGIGDGTYTVIATVGRVAGCGDDREYVKRIEIVLIDDEQRTATEGGLPAWTEDDIRQDDPSE